MYMTETQIDLTNGMINRGYVTEMYFNDTSDITNTVTDEDGIIIGDYYINGFSEISIYDYKLGYSHNLNWDKTFLMLGYRMVYINQDTNIHPDKKAADIAYYCKAMADAILSEKILSNSSNDLEWLKKTIYKLSLIRDKIDLDKISKVSRWLLHNHYASIIGNDRKELIQNLYSYIIHDNKKILITNSVNKLIDKDKYTKLTNTRISNLAELNKDTTSRHIKADEELSDKIIVENKTRPFTSEKLGISFNEYMKLRNEGLENKEALISINIDRKNTKAKFNKLFNNK